MTEKIKPRDKPHYVNNRQFSYAVVDYVTEANNAKIFPESEVLELPSLELEVLLTEVDVLATW